MTRAHTATNWLVRLITVAMLGMGIAASAYARPGEVRAGHYTIYYNTLTANALPEVSAHAYGLRHRADQGLVTLAVNMGDGATGHNVPFTVSGKARTLLDQPVPLTIRYFNDEHGNHAALVLFTVHGGETVRFKLEVTPPHGRATELRFVHSFGP
jgi:hypothetical protein